jgi:tetratricopeptide (TPR) repeat protein
MRGLGVESVIFPDSGFALKNAFVIVTLSSLMAACATAPSSAPVAPAPTPVVEAAPADPEAGLPKVELTGKLLYQLTSAEFEFRSGNYQGPYLTILSLAQQTRDPRLAQRAAEMAITAKQADDALAALRLWRQLAPNSDEAAQYYLGLIILTERFAEAEPILQARLAAMPPAARGLALFQTQQLLARAPDKEAAGAMLVRLVAPYANTVEGHVVLSQGAFARGAKADAAREAKAALAIKPDSELAVLSLAQALEDDAKVGVLLKEFLDGYPNALEVRAAYARVLVNRKAYDAARAEFLVLQKAQPDNPAHIYALGVLAMQMNQPAVAEQYLTRFLDVLGASSAEDKDPSKVLVMLSQLAEERGDLKAALAWLDKVGSDDPKMSLAVQVRRAQLSAKQGDLPAARRILAAINAAEPAERAQLIGVEAQLLTEAGKPAEAYALMEKAAAKYPKNPDLLYDFALMAEKAGKTDVMEKTLRRVMAQAPDNQHAYNALGYSLAERNVRLPEALQLIRKAQEMAPNDPFIMDSMGWVLYRMGNLDEAEAQLRRAYELRPDADIAVHLGEVLWKKGSKDEALTLWRAAKAKEPRNDALRTTLARLNQAL